MSSITEEIRAILADPSASNWLKQAIRDLLARDLVDAVNDAESLVDLIRRRFDHIRDTPRHSRVIDV